MDAERILQLLWTGAWQIAAAAAAVAVIVRFTCRNRPHLAYALWLVVLLKCITPPLWSSPTSVFSWAAAHHEQQPAARAEVEDSNSADRFVFARARMDSVPRKIQLQPHRDIAVFDVAPVDPLPFALLGVWLLGVAIAACWFVARLASVRRALRSARIPPPEKLLGLSAELGRSLGVRKMPRIFVTRQPFGPALAGLLRPAIVLPALLVHRKSAGELRPIVAHELVHLRRGDLWIALLQAIARIVWWFHPAVWLVDRRLECLREQCCDEEVIAELNCEPSRYAEMLLDVLQSRHRLRQVGFAPGIRPLQVTKGRLAHIMDTPARFRRRTPKLGWLLLAVGSVILLPATGIVLSSKPPRAQSKPVSVQSKPRDGDTAVPAPPPAMLPLMNSDFELPTSGGGIPGWSVAGAGKATIETVGARSGKQSLRLTSSADWVSLRSDPFAVPKSGRILVSVFLMIDDPSPQPEVRFVLEGLPANRQYRPTAVLGAGAHDLIPAKWQRFDFRVYDLPIDALSQLRFRIDLKGRSGLLVDDVQLFDPVLPEVERTQLKTSAAQVNDSSNCEWVFDSKGSTLTCESFTLNGKVVDTRGKPVRGATVRVVYSSLLGNAKLQAILNRPPRADGPPGIDTTYKTDANGNYSFTLAADQPQAPWPNIGAEISHPGFARRVFPPRDMRSTGLGKPNGDFFFPTVTIAPAEEINGTIVDPSGKPLAGVRLAAGSFAWSQEVFSGGTARGEDLATTDSRGKFRLVVPQGDKAEIFGRSAEPEYLDLRQKIGLRRGDVGAIRMAAGQRLSIQVVDLSGKPLAGVPLEIERDQGDDTGSVIPAGRTDRDGRFLSRAIPEGGCAIVAFDEDGSLQKAFELEVVHVSGTHPCLPIIVHELPHVTFRGRVVDNNGNPLDAWLFWTPDFVRNQNATVYLRTTKRGGFSLSVPLETRWPQSSFVNTDRQYDFRVLRKSGEPIDWPEGLRSHSAGMDDLVVIGTLKN